MTPIQCSALRKNGHVVIKGRPCKIVDMSTSKTGKHGHAKVHLVAIDIFTKKKLEDLCPSTHNMNVPVLKRADYDVIDISDEGFLTLMDTQGNTREDVRIPQGEMGDAIRAKWDGGEGEATVNVCAAMGEEHVVGLKGWNEKS
eukprot:TRINITY_DN3279_c0_g1_i5.p2 TRINITY_DN3279_c0_g1~~TRINITY_DN3279_c0_g1_i5.p2  ORF type:complete len:155 (-),score=33.89 TRINITY_DN3279_c0_g1_i5:47-475(-)